MIVFIIDTIKPLDPMHQSEDKQYGFLLIKSKPRDKKVRSFQTGYIVKATLKSGKKIGQYLGRLALRPLSAFILKPKGKTTQGISWKYCKLLYASDGYTY